MTLHPRRTTAAAVAILLAVCSTTVRADTWKGGTSGNQNWNTAGNWNPAVPNGSGATATFSTLTGALTLPADTAAATAIKFGFLTLTSGQNVTLGGASDLGTYTLDNGGSNVEILFNNVTDNRYVALSSAKANQFTLNSNVVVKDNGGTGTHYFWAQVNTSGYQINGNNKTITTQGKVSLVTSGNASAYKNVTLDLRQSTAVGTADYNATFASQNDTTVPTSDNNKILIGKTGATQTMIYSGNQNLGYAVELSGNVLLQNSGGRNWTMSGQITNASGAETAKLQLVHNTALNKTVTFTPNIASTYQGGTTVDFSSSGVSSGTLALTKAGALGRGDVDVTRLLNLTFGASYALGTSSTASSNGITFSSTCGLTTLALATYTQSLRSVKVGTVALVPGTYTASQLETALEAAGLPATLSVTGSTGTWIILPPPPPPGTVVLVR
jgi:hypothetical protein